jgi:hypothetical protein
MLFNLFFNLPVYTKEESTFPIPENEDYSYWNPLMKYFLDKADSVEFQCWNEEVETINELKSLFIQALEIVLEENLTIFKGPVTPALSNYLLLNFLNERNELKWFTVNLGDGEKEVFHSGHWGTEFFASAVIEEDIAYIKGVTPVETGFHQDAHK